MSLEPTPPTVPTSSDVPQPEATARFQGYRGTEVLNTALVVSVVGHLLWQLVVVSALVRLFFGAEQALAIFREGFPDQDPYDIVQVPNSFSLIVYIVGGCLYFIWFHRSVVNARRLGAEDLTVHPHDWAWIVVPFWGIWKHYEAMSALWMSTSRGPHDLKVRPPGLMTWWSCILISGLFRAFALGPPYGLVDVGDIQHWAMTSTIAELLLIASAIGMIRCVSAIDREQAAQARSLGWSETLCS